MSQQVSRVDTLFCHERDGQYSIAVIRDGERVLQAVLTLNETAAGPRPGKFRVKEGSNERPRQPDTFVEIARRADRIRVSEQTSREGRSRLREMFAGYQLDGNVKTVRTCRLCAQQGRYSPITSETAIERSEEYICSDCARRELEREAGYRGLTAAARKRLEELLFEVQDFDRIVALLSGNLDGDLTKFDEMSATTEVVDPVQVSDLDLHPAVADRFTDRFDSLLPVQSLAVEKGLIEGRDQLVVSATATGKTLIGELAGIDRAVRGEGKMLFLVPLVALANQKHEDFEEDYGDLVDVTIRVGASRIRGSGARFDREADVIVGTYEGIDHALRTGKDLGEIGTVVIDEVHGIANGERGNRLDGLISRLRYYCEQRTATNGTDNGTTGTQWLYLSATVGNPEWLAEQFGATLVTLVEFEERPVPIERHVTFLDSREKPDVADQLVTTEFDRESSKGYRGQTIVFTNSRRRCHELARRIEYDAAPYHAGLDYGERKSIERRFGEGDLAAVVTTAALAAGVDFPASQVIFDALAMGIEWLSVQEFHQMLGRAGRPDYHDRGVVYLLVEPDGTYHSSTGRTEDEVAFQLLKGEMEPVTARIEEESAVEETLANVVVGGSRAKALDDRMIAAMPTERTVGRLLEYGFIDGLSPTPLGQAVTEHFLSPTAAFTMLDGIRKGSDPVDILAEIELLGEEG
ncbi:DEAD/DEAH box helicase [Halobacteriales archaeon QS_3_64_16]|nr:MAG: DEAD/DEAH box helicase [Halobacteriales archaeon QS_3_64_16]